MALYAYEPLLTTDGTRPVPGAVVGFYADTDTEFKTPLEVFTLEGESLGFSPVADKNGYINNAGGYMLPVQYGKSKSGKLPAVPVFSVRSVIEDAKGAAGSAATSEAAAVKAAEKADQIPALVTQATASNSTVVQAAAAAVDANPKIAELQATAVFTGDPRLPAINKGDDYLHAWTDNAGRVPLGIKSDATVMAPGGIESPRVGMPLESSNGLAWAMTSPSGQISEMALGQDGCVPDWVLERWAGRMGTPRQRKRRTALALTHASGSNQKDTRTAMQSRIPLKVGVDATIKAIHIRNYEDRTGLAYGGALSFTGVHFGMHGRDASGQMNGQFIEVPQRVAGAFTTPADGGEYVIDGLDIPVRAGIDYLLSYGYTCAAQENHKGVGGCWTNGSPANVGAKVDETLARDKFTPLDIWFEVETSAPIVAYVGDSLSCGVSAEVPGYQSVPMIHGRANGYLPLMYTHSGSAMTSWVSPNVRKYTKWATLDKPDALVFSLSKNDFATAGDIATLRARFAAVYPVITAATTTNMYLTTCLPNKNEADANGELERAWNEVLLTEQLGNAVNVFDIRKAVTKPGGGLDPAHDCGDGVHLTKRGYAAVAAAITATLHG